MIPASSVSLVLSTSTPHGSIALGKEGKIVQEVSWVKEKSHSEKITIHLLELFEDSNIELQDLKLLICSKGPGSFTGIRVALSVIKTLAFAYNLPVIAVDDCYAVALSALKNKVNLPIAVILDAQKNKVFLGLYKIEKEKLITVLEPTLVALEELSDFLEEKQYLCLGDGFDRYQTFFPEDVQKKIKRDSQVSDFPSALTMYEFIFPLRESFEKLNWLAIEPLYLRESAAEEVRSEKTKKS